MEKSKSGVTLRGAGLERRLTQSEELDLLLANRYAAGGPGKLHPAVANLSSTFTKQTEENHLRNLIDKALPSILPEKEAQSKAIRIVVREIVSCSVLYPIVEMLSDPDFWNQRIDEVVSTCLSTDINWSHYFSAGRCCYTSTVCCTPPIYAQRYSCIDPYLKETHQQSAQCAGGTIASPTRNSWGSQTVYSGDHHAAD